MTRDAKAFARRLSAEMEKAQLDAVILTDPGSLMYATGYCVRSSGTLGVLLPDGHVDLICSEFHKNAIQEVVDPEYVRLLAYPCWIFIEDYAQKGQKKEAQPNPAEVFKMACSCIPRASGSRIGIQPRNLNYQQYLYLADTFGDKSLIDATGMLREAAAVKTPWEIQVLRDNSKATQQAMHKTAHDTQPGSSMAEIFDCFTKYSVEALPGTTMVSHWHTVASKFSPTTMPGAFAVFSGDLVLLDGGPCGSGYNADLGRVFAVGGVCSPDKQEVFDALWAGHQYQLEHIKPGERMCDVFQGVDMAIKSFSCMRDYGYIRGHYGHSLGCSSSGEEYPFIAPGETRVFEPGMVICIETPYYSSKHHNYNIEDTILVTKNGIELFSQAPQSLFY